MKLHLRAAGCRLAVLVLPDTSEQVNPSKTGRYSIYLSHRDGRLSWPRWSVSYWDVLPANRRSPIQVLPVTRQHMGSWCVGHVPCLE